MREIRFRAWDKEFNHMVYEGWAIRFKPLNKYCSGIMIEDYGAGREECYGKWNDCEDIIIMQFTGLHDGTKWDNLSKEEQEDWIESGRTKEQWIGKEIYEGDIVKTYKTNKEIILEINWNNHSVGFLAGHYFLELLRGYGNLGSPENDHFAGNCEVIGNIYENPELLNKET